MPEFPMTDITDEQAQVDRDRLEQLIAELREDGTSARHILELRGRLEQAAAELARIRSWIALQLEHSGERVSPAYLARQLEQLLGWSTPAESPALRYWAPEQVVDWRSTELRPEHLG
jgi:hypothetical protein